MARLVKFLNVFIELNEAWGHSIRIGRIELWIKNRFYTIVNQKLIFGKEANAPGFRTITWRNLELRIWRKYTVWGDHPFRSKNIIDKILAEGFY